MDIVEQGSFWDLIVDLVMKWADDSFVEVVILRFHNLVENLFYVCLEVSR